MSRIVQIVQNKESEWTCLVTLVVYEFRQYEFAGTMECSNRLLRMVYTRLNVVDKISFRRLDGDEFSADTFSHTPGNRTLVYFVPRIC